MEPASRGDAAALTARCREVLEAAWDADRGYCYPNRMVYPNQWLWDSCFHSIAWAATGDERGLVELEGVFAAQLVNGFVPHMRYAREELFRGPLGHASSFTQPPIYAHAARYLDARGLPIPVGVRTAIARALDYLWVHRRSPEGLIFIVHPWEAGSDDSPRWDSWVGTTEWTRAEWTAFDLQLVPATSWSNHGDANWSKSFVVAPAGFNALVSHAYGEHAALTGDQRSGERGREIAAAIDHHLWDASTSLWVDRPIVGGGASCAVPTLDGVLPALVTQQPARAAAALDQLWAARQFDAPFGPAFVWRSHPTYRSNGYWRGAAWPQMSYLMWLAAHRWGRAALALHLAETGIGGTLRSGFAELWDAETGEACGATPQTWAALAAAYALDPVVPEISASA